MPISEVGLKRIAELEARTKPMTDAMKLEYAELVTKRDKPPTWEPSDTCIEYLMEVFAWETQGMIAINKESMDLMQLRKGKMAERDAVRLISLADGVLYLENKDRIGNEFLSGEIDTYLGESVLAATNITDIKNSFDYPTFLKKINNGLENGQKEQMQGYGDISGSQELYIANVLVDTPDEIVEDMKWRLVKKFGALTEESPDFVREWEKWERSMKFNHIPIHQRVFKIKVEPFTENEKIKVYDRVKQCREWLFNFNERYQSLIN